MWYNIEKADYPQKTAMFSRHITKICRKCLIETQ